MQLAQGQFDTIRNWIYRKARPLDLARWQYHFENGAPSAVLRALEAYQNPDGGFGHALEADSWNPASAAIQTWTATEILLELDIPDYHLPLIQRLLAYLDNGQCDEEYYWYAAMASNNDHPHAPWWSYLDDDAVRKAWGYNPTIALLGFILSFAKRDSAQWRKAHATAQSIIAEYLQGPLLEDTHELSCFLRFYEDCHKFAVTDLPEMDALAAKLTQNVSEHVTQDQKDWHQYVCRPSSFFNSPQSLWYRSCAQTADLEAKFIIESINDEGVWSISWSWKDYADIWPIGRMWWQGNLVLQNMRYLRNFGCMANILL